MAASDVHSTELPEIFSVGKVTLKIMWTLDRCFKGWFFWDRTSWNTGKPQICYATDDNLDFSDPLDSSSQVWGLKECTISDFCVYGAQTHSSTPAMWALYKLSYTPSLNHALKIIKHTKYLLYNLIAK